MILNELDAEPDAVGRAETLLATYNPIALEDLAYPKRAKVAELVSSFGDELGVADPGALTDRLYVIAAAYTLPKLKRAAGQDSIAARTRLQQIAKKAGQLVSLLGDVDIELEVALGFMRPMVVDQTAPIVFHLKELKAELSDLAATTQACANEIPSMPRGRSVNVFHARLMEAATRAIGEASRVEIEVKQADSAGRNPRPGSSSAELLFRYLDLVEPKMPDKAKERLFAKFSLAWASVTAKEIEEDRYPRRWRRRTGRIDLIRDMPSK